MASIGDDVFYNCYGLTSVTIPDSVTSIGGWAFGYCSSLTSITIPDSVTSIGDSAFVYCTGLKNITIGSGVTSISYRAFKGCSDLASVIIGSGVTSISYGAFADCDNLTDVYYSGSEDEWGEIQIDIDENYCLTEANIHFNSAGIPIPSIESVGVTRNDNEYCFAVSLSDVPYNCKLIAVTYDENGTMTGFSYTDLNSGDEGSEVTVLADNADTAKVMIWDTMKSIKPLCEADTQDLTEVQ